MLNIIRYSSILLLLTFLFLACDADVEKPESTEQVTEETPSEEKTGRDLFNELKAQAVDANDVQGRLKASANKIQPILRASAERVPAFEQATAVIEEESTLRLTTQENGAKKEYLVDLRTFDSERIGLIADQSPEDLPGIRLRTIDGTKSVKEYVDGKLTKETDELVIYLATRKDIENLTPVLVQMIYLSQGRLE